jgi:hypothetical protein
MILRDNRVDFRKRGKRRGGEGGRVSKCYWETEMLGGDNLSLSLHDTTGLGGYNTFCTIEMGGNVAMWHTNTHKHTTRGIQKWTSRVIKRK